MSRRPQESSVVIERLHPRIIGWEERFWSPEAFADDLERRWPGGSLRQKAITIAVSVESVRRWTSPKGPSPTLESYCLALAHAGRELGAWLRPETLEIVETERRD